MPAWPAETPQKVPRPPKRAPKTLRFGLWTASRPPKSELKRSQEHPKTLQHGDESEDDEEDEHEDDNDEDEDEDKDEQDEDKDDEDKNETKKTTKTEETKTNKGSRKE